jgi:hypothetical protein
LSEYQYYEFRAIDRPLTAAELKEVQALSSRAEITPTRFQNVYNYGDFKGDPDEMVERFYDAHFYDSNFRYRRFLIRVPKAALGDTDITAYLTAETLRGWATESAFLLDFQVEDAEPDVEEDSESWLPDLLPIRDAIIAGDLRALYLAWLCGVQREEVDDDEEEPPVPPGLGELNDSLRRLSEFLELDPTLVEVAAIVSPPLGGDDPIDEAEARSWLMQLDDDAVTESLVQVMLGDPRRVKSSLLTAYKRALREVNQNAIADLLPQARRAGDLLDAAEELEKAQERARLVEQRRAEEERLRQQAAFRAAYLNRLRNQGERNWQQVEDLVSTKRPNDYDRALQLLLDLKEIHSADGDLAGFDARVFEVFRRHSKKPAFIERLRMAGLA